MSHGPQGAGWEIMWDSCWIALASEKQRGGEEVVEGGREGKPANSLGIEVEGVVTEGLYACVFMCV